MTLHQVVDKIFHDRVRWMAIPMPVWTLWGETRSQWWGHWDTSSHRKTSADTLPIQKRGEAGKLSARMLVHHLIISWILVCGGSFPQALLTMTFVIRLCFLWCSGSNTNQTEEPIFYEVSLKAIYNRPPFL